MPSFLITTSRSVIIAEQDFSRFKRIHTGKGVYYGITFTDAHVYVAARNSHDAFHGTSRETEILVFSLPDARLIHIETLPHGTVGDVHQIFLADGRITLTSTADNSLVEATVKASTFSGWRKYWPFPHEPQTADTKHVNSLVSDDADSLYLGAHCHGPSEIWRLPLGSGTAEKVCSIGHTAHNVWKHRGILHTLDSAHGTLVSASGTVIPMGHDWLRGVVFDERSGMYTIGASSVVNRQQRCLSDSRILQFDASHQIRRVLIRGEGQILDIRQPGVADLCHPSSIGAAIDFEAITSPAIDCTPLPSIRMGDAQSHDGDNTSASLTDATSREHSGFRRPNG